RDFTALVHVCTTSKNMLKDVEGAMVQTAMDFAGTMLAEPNVADLLLEQFADPDEISQAIFDFHAEAATELAARPEGATELFVLAGAGGPGKEGFVWMANPRPPGWGPKGAGSAGDNLLFRGGGNLAVGGAEEMGGKGQEAYQTLTATEHFTPHTRLDVAFE